MGVPIQMFSTRPPSARDRARHGFAEDAARETIYLWPIGLFRAVGLLLWAAATRPAALLRCVGLGLTLPVDRRPGWLRVLPLIVPACALAKESERLGVRRIHSHTCANSAVLCMMVKRLSGLPYSMTLNANIEWWGGAMREKFGEADFTIAITQWLLDQIRRDYPDLAPEQALLGRIGVDTRKWAPTSEPGSARPAGVRLLTVGRLHESKGHDVLIGALKILADEGKDVSLRIIGEGPRRQDLEALTASSRLSGRVEFLGSLSEDQIIAQMREADLFVLASHAEPLGVVYMEAMAMQVATIGTAAGGVGEIITDGVDGLLVPPGDPVGLADAIRRLMADEPLRLRLAAAGRQTIVDRFDSRIGAATLYERLHGQPPTDLRRRVATVPAV